MVVSPLVAQLSDRFGRRHFGSWGRIGWIIFFSGHRIRDRSLTHRLWFEAIPWGIIQAGTWPVFAAAHSDVFGERPQLSARIKSRDGMYISIAGVCGPIVTVLVSRTVGLAATEHLCSVLAGASIVLQLANKETLTPAKRKPFSLSQANPFANVHLLFTNGPGLRRLASSTSLWFWCNEIWSTQAAFRMGVLRWTPIQTGIFDCIYHLTETVAHKPLVDPILKACSNRSAFEIGALLSALAYLVQSFSWWSAAGAASKLRMSLQYGVGICLLTTVPVTMKYTMRAMVVACAPLHSRICLHVSAPVLRAGGCTQARHQREPERGARPAQLSLRRAWADHGYLLWVVLGRSLPLLLFKRAGDALVAALGAWRCAAPAPPRLSPPRITLCWGFV